MTLTERLASYSSYNIAWFAPIVYPLSLSIISIAYTSRDLLKTGKLKQPQNLVAAAVVGVEAFFASCCLIQCALNFAKREYAGGDRACDFQGWYATWWVFSSMLMGPLVGMVSFAAASPTAQLAMPTTGRVAATIVSILTLAMLIALLPFTGVGQIDFLKDYCMFDMTNKSSGGIYMAIFFACSIMTVLFHVKTASALKAELPAAPTEPTKEAVALPACGCLTPKTLQYGMIAWHFIIWLPTATIVLLYLVKAIEPPASSAISAIIAITLHSQQLFQPLIVGLVWRRWVTQHLESIERNEGKRGNKAGPSPSKLQEAAATRGSDVAMQIVVTPV